ncbi:MAG: type II toxin-antitoxin system Phd/YefM family antitoxin [Chloroflexota bacterium]
MHKSVNIAHLKACLSSYLKEVKNGEEILITERGKAIAWIVPYTRAGSTPAEYEEMIKSGQLRPARSALTDDFWDGPLVPDPNGLVLKALLEERESGW